MADIISLDSRYSTTQFLTKQLPNFGKENILKSILFYPNNKNRKGEGGLRTKGYYKVHNKSPGNEQSQNYMPTVTIITVVFNGDKNLEKTIESIIKQTYKNIEYIIIDGGSTDRTLDILKKYEHAIDYWVSEPDAGIYDAWNKGLKLATGEWISFIGADDTYEINAIENYVNYINEIHHTQPEYVSSKVNLISNGKILRVIGEKWKWRKFKKYMNTAHVGSLHKRTIYEKYGTYNINYKICGDYELLLRPKNELRTSFINSVTANMYLGGISNQDLRTFEEAFTAKIQTAGRNRLLCKIEKYNAIIIWKIRSKMYDYFSNN